MRFPRLHIRALMAVVAAVAISAWGVTMWDRSKEFHKRELAHLSAWKICSDQVQEYRDELKSFEDIDRKFRKRRIEIETKKFNRPLTKDEYAAILDDIEQQLARINMEIHHEENRKREAAGYEKDPHTPESVFRRAIMRESVQANYHIAMSQKYRYATWHPWTRVAPDPPAPQFLVPPAPDVPAMK